MFESMYVAQGVGLAAAQIGLSKRLAVVDVSVGKNPEARLALEIRRSFTRREISAKKKTCLSLPGFRGRCCAGPM